MSQRFSSQGRLAVFCTQTLPEIQPEIWFNYQIVAGKAMADANLRTMGNKGISNHGIHGIHGKTATFRVFHVCGPFGGSHLQAIPVLTISRSVLECCGLP
jgi:hypothetical protein